MNKILYKYYYSDVRSEIVRLELDVIKETDKDISFNKNSQIDIPKNWLDKLFGLTEVYSLSPKITPEIYQEVSKGLDTKINCLKLEIEQLEKDKMVWKNYM